ncbi:hypothetical protein AGABI1DRAFT_46482 [Agaricus bisporus var. burnettii JB137-S8]|uniref:Uncharacterized protein n=2 Tax=Agaricus bisporus var. burnettii TaxID=192524 RepID=K5WX94_AGABU|nr:uncharacterized protein AGABI1DRAFT_46482 [Agaricus bisporus var. burnettii JB137-S8]EKM75443.1 hypothetical protein AGABI1DRAFT_46482 [Agaricus bisporus var. burnettii JB137-S8]KAF7760079.1 hypothetical protein Agabi119p4_10755 [Agaricus bisporus var. burnettii]
MSSNKDRLEIALYARGGAQKKPGGEDRYHWALIVAPKREHQGSRGIRFHATEKLQSDNSLKFVYDERDIDVFYSTNMLLVRIIVAKVEKIDRVCQILRAVPVRQRENAGWNCIAWVKEALEMLDADEGALGTRTLEWNKIWDTAMTYCGGKISSHRFDGKVELVGIGDPRRPPTFDLLENKEVVP